MCCDLRVMPLPQEKDKVKLTVVYLMRPDTDSVFVNRNGKQWSSVNWHSMKYRLSVADLNSQASTNALTGRLGLDDLLKKRPNLQVSPKDTYIKA
ncbi:hypothetical protein BDV40DRAFT_268193 [Aspergillus tamarii]|uniref:Uncharacterized protein n=1 Tax=Aspergillus tamarii TaxID=41984 RepID=A0A5N6URL0_ASPTM|nr:hypothetical protein BDV40DRAFT_268193 [Aspergillus tamarii]